MIWKGQGRPIGHQPVKPGGRNQARSSEGVKNPSDGTLRVGPGAGNHQGEGGAGREVLVVLQRVTHPVAVRALQKRVPIILQELEGGLHASAEALAWPQANVGHPDRGSIDEFHVIHPCLLFMVMDAILPKAMNPPGEVLVGVLRPKVGGSNGFFHMSVHPCSGDLIIIYTAS